MITLASHPNGARVIMPEHGESLTLISHKIFLNIPSRLIKKTTETFENGTTMHIAQCDFLDGYLGVDFSSLLANHKLEEVLNRVLNEMLKAGKLCDYFSNKGFNTAIWLSIANPSPLKLKTLILY
jgi:hypothetical protein